MKRILSVFLLISAFVCSRNMCAQEPTVVNPPALGVQTINVTANPTSITVGGAQGTSTLHAVVTDSNGGQNIDVTYQCAWTSGNTAVFTVSGNVATGVASGTANAICTLPTLPTSTMGSIPITVSGSPLITNPSAAFCAGVNPCPLPGATNGSLYSYSFTASDTASCCTWTISAGTQPTGLSLNAGSGVLSGTPTVNGTFNFTITATDTLTNAVSLPVSILVSAAATCVGNFGGPPTYPCGQALPTGTNPGLITPLFVSGNYQGTVNTSAGAISSCTSNCMQWVSGDLFQTTWNVFQTNYPNQIFINGVKFPVLTWLSTTLAKLGSNPGTQTGVSYLNFSTCKPGSSLNGTGNGCQNSTAYDTTIPGYVNGSGCITKMTDLGSMSNSVGSFTATSGAERNMSINYDWAIWATNGGSFFLFNITVSGGCYQVVNTGPAMSLAAFHPGSAVFSSVTDNVFYITNVSSTYGTEIDKCTIASATSVSCVLAFDYFLATTGGPACPGVTPFVTKVGPGEFSLDEFDHRIPAYWGSGNQGSAYWGFSYDMSTHSCSSVNLNTGQAWAFCTASCSPSTPPLVNGLTGASTFLGNVNTTSTQAITSTGAFCPTTSSNTNMYVGQTLLWDTGGLQEPVVISSIPGGLSHKVCITNFAQTHLTGVPITFTSPACWGAPGAGSLNNLHAALGTPDGTIVILTITGSGTWTQGMCAGDTNGSINVYWTAGTLTNNGIDSGNTYQFGSHAGLGQSNHFSPDWRTMNYRPYNNPASFTSFYQGLFALGVADLHGGKALYCAGTGTTPNDNCPWTNITNSVAATQTSAGTGNCPVGKSAVYCPTYLNNVVVTWFPFPTPSYPPGQVPLVLAHSYACGYSGAKCDDGIRDQFGPGNTINTPARDGTGICWATTMLHQEGTDASNFPAAIVLCMRL